MSVGGDHAYGDPRRGTEHRVVEDARALRGRPASSRSGARAAGRGGRAGRRSRAARPRRPAGRRATHDRPRRPPRRTVRRDVGRSGAAAGRWKAAPPEDSPDPGRDRAEFVPTSRHALPGGRDDRAPTSPEPCLHADGMRRRGGLTRTPCSPRPSIGAGPWSSRATRAARAPHGTSHIHRRSGARRRRRRSPGARRTMDAGYGCSGHPGHRRTGHRRRSTRRSRGRSAACRPPPHTPRGRGRYSEHTISARTARTT